MLKSLLVATALLALSPLAQGGEVCRVLMKDSVNKFTAELGAYTLGSAQGDHFLIVNTAKKGHSDWVVATFKGEGAELESSAASAVPQTTKSEILSRASTLIAGLKKNPTYRENAQLTWTLPKEAKCSDNELGLIYFFVLELFYYG